MTAARPDLANPDYEPSDEELAELVHRAFRDVGQKNETALARLRGEIASARREALALVTRLRDERATETR